MHKFSTNGTATQTPPELILVGNKNDLPKEKRQVSISDARKFATKHKIGYYETSAANGDGIKKLFQETLEKLMSKKKVALQTKVLTGSTHTVTSSVKIKNTLSVD